MKNIEKTEADFNLYICYYTESCKWNGCQKEKPPKPNGLRGKQ